MYRESMPEAMRRSARLVALLWFCVLVKLTFYSSFVPVWEGYDEFAHFAFVEHLVNSHSLPDLKNSTVPRDVVESLHAVPVPWTVRNWLTFSVPHDDYWRAHPPPAKGDLPDLRLYEAQQPPLAYLFYAVPYAMFRHAGMLTRAWVVRMTGSLVVSLVIPLGFLLARRVFGNGEQAIAALAIVASLPELMMTADHGGNEPLAIVLGTMCVLALVSRRGLVAGCLLGLGLLTKAYFLTLLPIVVFVFWRHRRKMFLALAAATVIAGWWYGRAVYVTGSLTGTQFAGVTTRPFSAAGALFGIPWLRVADFALISHIWLGGWSFLVIRTWMYRAIELTMFAAAAGVVLKLTRKRLSEPVAICAGALGCFIAGMAYFAYATGRATGDAAVMGYYAYALVVPEAVCIVAGLSSRRIIPAVIACLGLIEVYGTVFCLMPYYAGLTAHTARGGVPAGRIGQIFSAELFRNLAANKPGFLTPGVLIAMWILFLAAICAITAVGFLSAFGKRSEA